MVAACARQVLPWRIWCRKINSGSTVATVKAPATPQAVPLDAPTGPAKPQPHWLEVRLVHSCCALCTFDSSSPVSCVLASPICNCFAKVPDPVSHARFSVHDPPLAQMYYMGSCICAFGTGVALWVEGTRRSKAAGATG